MKKFRHLNIPTQWEQYWSKYPNGYSILESLIDWVSQVDDMVDNQNLTVDTVELFGDRLDDFIGKFDTHLQSTVSNTLEDWQDSGFLNTIINETLDTKYHEMDERLTTQLAQTEYDLQESIQNTDSNLTEHKNESIIHRPIYTGQNKPAVGLGVDGDIYLQTYSENEAYFYEEGNFTPSIFPDSEMTVEYSEQTGYYVRYGNMVHVTINLGISSITFEQSSGGFSIEGLPYEAARMTGISGAVFSNTIPAQDNIFSGGLIVGGFNRIAMQQFNPTTGERAQARRNSLKAGSVINLEFTYQVNAGVYQ